MAIVEETLTVCPEAWIKHFRKLLYDNNERNENTVVANDFEETENLSDDETLRKTDQSKRNPRTTDIET